MKYIFFGTPEFASIILGKLINAGFIPEAVVCNPDKPAGRKKIITPPPIKKVISEKGLAKGVEVLQPEKLDNRLITQLFNYKPDFFIVAAYAKILPKEILEIPRLGTIGVHPSLLPKYRGSSPIQSAILNGDEKTGTTLFLINEKMDQGAIMANSEFRIENSELNYEKLHNKLAELSADLLIEILPNIENKIKNAKEQNESEAIYVKKIKTEDGYVNPEDLKIAQDKGGEKAFLIERKIRAFNPEPGVFTIINFQRIKLLEAKISDNKLKLIKIQKSGKKPNLLSGNLNCDA